MDLKGGERFKCKISKEEPKRTRNRERPKLAQGE